jgi:hypothetical protein
MTFVFQDGDLKNSTLSNPTTIFLRRFERQTGTKKSLFNNDFVKSSICHAADPPYLFLLGKGENVVETNECVLMGLHQPNLVTT